MSNPRISIGLPVYNGENFVAQAIESLRSQTFTDFELLISDNASTDGTEAICRNFAEQDPRIRYERLPENIGAAPNFNRVFHRTRGDYFKWAAHDDACLAEYLAECVSVLDRDPSIVLCHTEVDLINENSARVRRYEADIYDFDAPRPQDRFRNLVFSDHMCIDVFGLIRREALARTPLIASHTTSDRILLAELGLKGRFHRSPRMLFLSRDHAGRSVRSLDVRERLGWFDTRLNGRVALPFWRTWFEYFFPIFRVSLPLATRAECLASLLHWPIQNRGVLWGDLRAVFRLRTRLSAMFRIPNKVHQS